MIRAFEWHCIILTTSALIALLAWGSTYIRGQSLPRLLFKRLRTDAVVPRYMTAHAAGLDLAAAIDAPVDLAPGQRAAIDTGLAIKLPEGYEAQIRPRSGLACDHGVTLVNAPGTIDADYTGMLRVLLINHGDRPVRIDPGQRIAQLVISPVVRAALCEVDELPATLRGSGGFGSTGTDAGTPQGRRTPETGARIPRA